MAAGPEQIVARNVLLASGVCDIEPKLPNLRHAIPQGYVRHCPGLYAAGDVIAGLNQISVAYAGGAIAATEIHNSLPKANSA